MSWNGTSIGKTDSISFTDVNNALGITKNPIDLSEICTSSLINPYSLYKPMSVSCGKGLESSRSSRKLIGLEEQDMKRLNYGYELPVGGTLNSVITAYVRGGADPWESTLPGVNIGFGWSYIKPKGGEADPYRIGDFRGYNAKNTEAFVLNGDTEVGVLPPSYSIGGQFPHDMDYFSENNTWYWGLIFIKQNSAVVAGVPIVTNILGNSQTADIDLSQTMWNAIKAQLGLRTGNIFKVVPVLHNTSKWHGCSQYDNINSDDGSYVFVKNTGLVNTYFKTIPSPVVVSVYNEQTGSGGVGGNKPSDPTPKVFVSIYDVSISGTTCTFKTKIESANGTAVSSLSTYITTHVEGMYNNYDCASDESGYGALRTITNGGTQSVNFSYNAKYEDDYGLEHTIRLQHGTLYISVWTGSNGYYYTKGGGEIEF